MTCSVAEEQISDVYGNGRETMRREKVLIAGGAGTEKDKCCRGTE